MSSFTKSELATLRMPLLRLGGINPIGMRVGYHDAANDMYPMTGIYLSSYGDREILVSHCPEDVPETWGLRGTLVDLADMDTRDRVARWCGKQLGWPTQATAPTLVRTMDWSKPKEYTCGWHLLGDRDEYVMTFYAYGKAVLPNDKVVHSLSALLPVNDRRLPDGSTYAEAAALAVISEYLSEKVEK